jgi:MFS family permease
MTTSTAPVTLTGSYRIGPTHSRVGFLARHAMRAKARGPFSELGRTGTVALEEPSRSGLEVAIEAPSTGHHEPGGLMSQDLSTRRHRLGRRRVASPTAGAVRTAPVEEGDSTVRRSRSRANIGFWLAAAAFLVPMAFSTVPTPLYVLYQHRDGFSSFVVTLVFAVYAVGVVISLLLAGHISDWVGRKRVLIPALALEVLAAVLFLVWQALPGLIVARFVSGLGIGMITATATAYLRDLQAQSRPGTGTGRFEVVSTAANIGGLGVGTLVSGALAQSVSSPLSVPYAVFAGLLVLSVAALALAPESVRPPASRPRYRPQRPTVSGDRTSYLMVATGTFVSFAVFGVFTSLAPRFVAVTLDHPSLLLAGLVPFVVFAAAALAQTVTGRLTNRARMLLGVGAQAAGLVLVAVGMEAPNLAAFLIGGGVAGAGAGVLFKSALATLLGSAEPAKRGEVAAGLFLVAYVGLSIPVLGVGIATLYVSATTAMLLFSGALVAVLAVLGILLAAPSVRNGHLHDVVTQSVTTTESNPQREGGALS